MVTPHDDKRDPLHGKQVVSAIATGGGGSVFQARVAALYLANLLTGVPTAFGLHGARVKTLRLEARYAGAHTDDILCELSDGRGSRRLLIQCKRGLDAVPSNDDFVDGLQAAWRDFLGVEGSPFDRSRDTLVLATVAPGSSANRAAKRLCELSRASVGLADFLLKLETKLFDAQHKRTWGAFKDVSKGTLGDQFDEENVFALLQCMRIDIHDLGVETSQELSLVQALLDSGRPGESGEQLWNGLFSYVLDQGVNVGTVTRESWRATASAGLQEAADRVTSQQGLGGIGNRFSDRASLQLSLISATLPNGTRIPRGPCVAQVLAGLDEHRLVVIAGGAGAGKSAVVAELTPLLLESGPLFFFRSDELDQPGLSAVQSLSGVPDPLLSLDQLLDHGAPTVVIDSLEKALEARNPGALRELLSLVHRHKLVRLCVTTRSYALNALFTNFLYNFSFQVVDVPALTDPELAVAVAGTPLETLISTDGNLREVLRAPFYIRLALNHTALGTALPGATAGDLRLALWTEVVAPSQGLGPGLADRRRAAFDEVCYVRTERFSQFVDAPLDAEAVTSLLRDEVLSIDAAGRVAPAHDVLEDWSLFFNVARQVKGAERDWPALFGRLGSHAGMRRALRAWTALRSAESDPDAYALLESSLALDPEIPQLWRDEIAIGLLRSERVGELIPRLALVVDFDSAHLLQRLSHLLRVACKGHASIDYSGMADDPDARELRLRLGMAAPVGTAWDVALGLVAKVFPSLSADSHSWVVQLAEDATAHDANWHEPSQRTRCVYEIAEQVCSQDTEWWHRDQTLGRRFFALLCRCVGAAPAKFEALVAGLVVSLTEGTGRRDIAAEQRLEFLVNVSNGRQACFFVPNVVWQAFRALYVSADAHTDRGDRGFGLDRRDAELGLSDLSTHAFFPPSALQGPFRWLLLHDWPGSVIAIVDLCNHAAQALATRVPNAVVVVPAEQSPNSRPFIHGAALWSAYRGLGVTSYLLNSALMALEERLLAEAGRHQTLVSLMLEVVVEKSNSSLTVGLVAGVLSAHPALATDRLLCVFRCPAFFPDDLVRASVQESSAMAIHGGHDGLDEVRQQERVRSNKLPHRRFHLEVLMLQLQLHRPDLREACHGILDEHLQGLKNKADVPHGWRMALKRMDARGLRLGEPTADGTLVPLEIAELEPELKRASDEAEDRLQRVNRIAGLQTWAGAITGRFAGADLATRERFLQASEVYEAFRQLCESVDHEEIVRFPTLEDELIYAMCTKWPMEDSEAMTWARSLLIERTAVIEHKDAWPMRDHSMGQARARAVVLLAAHGQQHAQLAEALVNLVTEPMWKLRWAASTAIAEDLLPLQPLLAEILVTGLAQYAEALTKRMTTEGRHDDLVDGARAETTAALLEALRRSVPGVRPSPKGLACIKEWLIAIAAAQNEAPDAWRTQALITLTKSAADHERGPQSDRHDSDHVDFESKRNLADLLAGQLLAQTDASSPLFATLDYCVEGAPELAAELLESALSAAARHRFENAPALWRIWDRAMAKVFPLSSLRTKSRRTYSHHDKVLKTLLLCSAPWTKGLYNLSLLKSRPRFVSDALVAVGDSRAGLECLLRVASGIGRVSAIPSALPQLRDALNQSPRDMLDDGECLWHLETICRVAIHDHREALLRDVRLRRATLDMLDRLVDAGSSMGFQLRDYLATTPSTSVELSAELA